MTFFDYRASYKTCALCLEPHWMPSSVTKDAKTVSNDFSQIQKHFFFVRSFATFHRVISKILQLGGNNIYIFYSKNYFDTSFFPSAIPSETMILENLNGSSAIRTEYTGHKTKGKRMLHVILTFCELQLSSGL